MKSSKYQHFGRFMVVILLTIFALASTVSAKNSITICGTGDYQELMRELAQSYMRSHPGTSIHVPDSIGSGGGIRSTAKGQCDLGRVARQIKDDEKRFNLRYQEFAYSPVVFIVNPNVDDIQNLSSEQILGIYSGHIKGWEEVGGKRFNIYVANREVGDSARVVLEDNIPGFREIKSPVGETVYTTVKLLDTIEKYNDTIGYVSLSAIRGHNVKTLDLDGITPTMENVRNGTYGLNTPFGIVWRGELSGLSRDFSKYLLGPEAKKIILNMGAVPAGRI